MRRVLTEDMVLMRTKCSKMELIRNLNLWGNDLHDIAVIKRMPQLEVLSLSVNHISSLADLRYCPKLSELYLRKNDVRDLAEVHHLKNLRNMKVLWLSDNPCANLPHYRLYILQLLPHLTKIDSTDVTEEERMQAAEAHLNHLPTCCGEDPDQYHDQPQAEPVEEPIRHSVSARMEFTELEDRQQDPWGLREGVEAIPHRRSAPDLERRISSSRQAPDPSERRLPGNPSMVAQEAAHPEFPRYSAHPEVAFPHDEDVMGEQRLPSRRNSKDDMLPGYHDAQPPMRQSHEEVLASSPYREPARDFQGNRHGDDGGRGLGGYGDWTPQPTPRREAFAESPQQPIDRSYRDVGLPEQVPVSRAEREHRAAWAEVEPPVRRSAEVGRGNQMRSSGGGRMADQREIVSSPQAHQPPSSARADNVLCAVLALVKELDQQGLELARRAVEQQLAVYSAD
eukprot:gnl/TRDRNA2_/TRDRNA2_87307_c0_seq1.p1 gnl/TRDRNA2_/TRDRNA2_87307_c0~~gnl/TRDRNA2_/TRDRNA2_87307_c0_seq1.p1  ORF type:complete len:466 (+),score=69.67 gnl/TRDRNA2_/TRDRNA2_87307_c0_seq1:45-1400(+)